MKKVIALALAALLVLSLAACGSGSGSSSNSGSSAGSADTGSTDTGSTDTGSTDTGSDAGSSSDSSATPAFDTISDGVLTMATNAAFPPYEMTTDDSGVNGSGFEGIDVEIAFEIADRLGLELQIDDKDFDSALLSVQQGSADIVMAGVSVTEDRLAVMNFSDSYATGIQVIIVPEGSDITVDTLGDHLIGTQRATTGNIYCTDDYGEEHVVAYDNGITAVQALMNGQVDCVVIDSAPAAELVAANTGLTILPTEYVVEDYAIGVAKENVALLDAINEVLAQMQADGTMQSIIDSYISAE